MASGLLSLKWNNHKTTFFHVLSTIRSKESYCDVTLACDGKFYPLHKFVLSTCSEYFEQMFEQTQCKHPVIVLKDIQSEDLEALLNYMYVGEVNVVQEKLAGLIKAAECLKIKGLAVPDEEPVEGNFSREQSKRHSNRHDESPKAKKRKRNSEASEDTSRSKFSNRDSNVQNNSKLSSSEQIHRDAIDNEEMENSSLNANRLQSDIRSTNSVHKEESITQEITLDDNSVKPEPIDLESEESGNMDNKNSLHQELGFEDSMAGDDDNYVDVDPSMLGNVDDSQNMAGSSGFQGSSFPMWEGDGSLAGFPTEAFSGDGGQNRPMTHATSDESPYDNRKECPYCHKCFRSNADLTRHMHIHEGVKPFACALCPHRARRKWHLQNHTRSVHVKTGESFALTRAQCDALTHDQLHVIVLTGVNATVDGQPLTPDLVETLRGREWRM